MIGTTLSHYSIEAELGRGGMGIVYKARDTKLDRDVAIKVLPAAALASEGDRARFYREAKAAAALNHPNIAQIYQIDEAVPEGSTSEDVRPYIAMEYIEGGTLEERIEQGPLKLAEAVRIASQVAEALKAAHAKEIVHRDIKSANIMLTADGQAKVLDFGLAQTTHSTKLTRMGSTLGTVAYMSPEQARGEDVDGRTDLYSLGAVLYEMIAGRLPFAGEYEQAVVYSILNADPEPLTALRTGVPMELERITGKALAKEADVRYQTAADFLADLKALDLTKIARMSTSAASLPAASTPGSGSTMWKAVAGGLTLVVVVLAFVLWMSTTLSPEVEESPIRLSLQVPDYGFPEYMALTRDASLLGITDMNGVYIHNMASGEGRYIEAPGTNRVTFNSDGTEMLLSGLRPLTRMRVDGSDAVDVAETRNWNRAAWGPNDEVLYSAFTSYLVRVPRSGVRDTLFLDSGLALFPWDVTPDGRVLVEAYRDLSPAGSYLWDVETMTVEKLGAQVAMWMPSGHAIIGGLWEDPFLAVVGNKGEVKGEIRPMSDLGSQWVKMAFSETGVLVLPGENDIKTWRLQSRRPDGTESTLTASMMSDRFALSRDQSRVAYRTSEWQGGSVVVQTLLTGIEHPVASGETMHNLIWGPADEWLYGGASGARIVRTPSTYSETPEEVFDFSFGSGTQWRGQSHRFIISLLEMEGDLIDELVEFDVEADSVTRRFRPGGRPTNAFIDPGGDYYGFMLVGQDQKRSNIATVLEWDTGKSWQLPLEDGVRAIRWSDDGSEIEYMVGDSLKAVPVSVAEGVQISGTPRLLGIFRGSDWWHRTSNGTIYYSQAVEKGDEVLEPGKGMRTLQLVVNWFDELERLLPTDGE